jgi:hypothetical protein
VQLVDTPGFNDTARSDMDILVTIANWIHVNKVAVAGIIYLYPITDMRFTGASRMNLKILKALCGEQFYPHLVLSSTMWNGIHDQNTLMQAKERERELLQSPDIWKDFLAKGAEYRLYSGAREQGQCIVDHLLSKQQAPSMAIVIELRDQSVDNTTAGQLIMEEGRKREEKLRQELLEEEVEERLLRRELELEQCGTARQRAGLDLIKSERSGDTVDILDKALQMLWKVVMYWKFK